MNITQILNEAQLSDITIGFELECILPSNSYVNRKLQDIVGEFGVEVEVDSSIISDGRYAEENTFEFLLGKVIDKDNKESQMRATPENIIKCAKFAYELFLLGAYTNETCGLHAHFGIGEITRLNNLENVWLTIYLIKTGILKEKYQEYKGYPLFDFDYANYEYVEATVNELITDLEEIGNINQRTEFLYHSLISRRNFEKYSSIFPHEQGTLEWRGLRGILDGQIKEDYNTILGFFKLAASFAKDLTKIINDYENIEVAGITLKDLQKFAYDQGISIDKSAVKDIVDILKPIGFPSNLYNLLYKRIKESKYFTQALYSNQESKQKYLNYFKDIFNLASQDIIRFFNFFEGKCDIDFILSSYSQKVLIHRWTVKNSAIPLTQIWANSHKNRVSLDGNFKSVNLYVVDIDLANDLAYTLQNIEIDDKSTFTVTDVNKFKNTKLHKQFPNVNVVGMR